LKSAGFQVVRMPAANDAVRVANRVRQAMTCMEKRDYRGALPHWERAVQLETQNAKHRFFYGVALWQARVEGDHARAIEQLQESCRIDAGWDKPFVEIAVALASRGLADLGVAHLDAGEARFGEVSDHFNWVKGWLLHDLGNYRAALVALERAVRLNPQHGAAFDLAADCAFKLGDKPRGRRYAKAGLDLGCGQSHARWNVG
jgi:tetratricopeptide (TPR) repeat protein